MTDVDYERVAREFLGWFVDHEDGHWRDSQRRSTIDPSPSWTFFGACWEECVKRGLRPELAQDECLLTPWGMPKPFSDAADPRVALPACIIQWLDAQGGTHD